MDYTPIDIRGSVLEGKVVNYACKNESAILNDGSGMGVYEAECINGTVGPTTWPACDIQVCSVKETVIPTCCRVKIKESRSTLLITRERSML